MVMTEQMSFEVDRPSSQNEGQARPLLTRFSLLLFR